MGPPSPAACMEQAKPLSGTFCAGLAALPRVGRPRGPRLPVRPTGVPPALRPDCGRHHTGAGGCAVPAVAAGGARGLPAQPSPVKQLRTWRRTRAAADPNRLCARCALSQRATVFGDLGILKRWLTKGGVTAACLQDLAAVELVPELIQAGVGCFKIEGEQGAPCGPGKGLLVVRRSASLCQSPDCLTTLCPAWPGLARQPQAGSRVRSTSQPPPRCTAEPWTLLGPPWTRGTGQPLRRKTRTLPPGR